jgi:hypothetical protein
MKIKVGDKVKFLNTIGGGRVTRIEGKDIAYVLNQDDFEIPVLISELVKINEDDLILGKSTQEINKPLSQIFKTREENKKPAPVATVKIEIEEPEEEYVNENPDLNVYFAIVPEDLKKLGTTRHELYLINDSNFEVLFNFIIPVNNKYKCVKSEVLSSNTKALITSYKTEEITKHTNYIIQLIANKAQEYSPMLPYHKEINLRPVKFFKENSFKENDFFDDKALLFTIVEANQLYNEVEKLNREAYDKIIHEKEVKSQEINKPKLAKPQQVDEIEVDVHIHQLIDDEAGLTNQEKLDIQMSKFRSSIEDAIKSQARRIVFIHGVGNGTLKMEIRRELESKYKKYQYQDASFKEYGFGATMVMLRK